MLPRYCIQYMRTQVSVLLKKLAALTRDRDAAIRCVSISVGLFCACDRSLLPYDRPLLTLTHTRTSGYTVCAL